MAIDRTPVPDREDPRALWGVVTERWGAAWALYVAASEALNGAVRKYAGNALETRVAAVESTRR